MWGNPEWLRMLLYALVDVAALGDRADDRPGLWLRQLGDPVSQNRFLVDELIPLLHTAPQCRPLRIPHPLQALHLGLGNTALLPLLLGLVLSAGPFL